MKTYVDEEGFVLENIPVFKDLDGEIYFVLYNGNKIEINHSLIYGGKKYYNFKASSVSGIIPETFKEYDEEDYFWVLTEGNAEIINDKCIHLEDVELYRRYNPDTNLISRVIRLSIPEEKLSDITDVLRKMVIEGKLIDYEISFHNDENHISSSFSLE